ncbi:hypothetical protein E4U56_003297 [Claviceps arundinis]|uniref:Uncharacterized protein n=1 Tax=Claviceps arundinis TaxID=1623583 RepID=A0A9P7SMC0_9HYPO|nr:hypothetical protein E4U56_003297 [Claviceps arundinis]
MEQQRQILPAPEPLTSRSGLDTWLASMCAKFAIDGLAIGLPKAQFFYVYSRLGAFQTTFLPYVTRTTDFNCQPDAFLTYISDTLGESHKERRAGLEEGVLPTQDVHVEGFMLSLPHLDQIQTSSALLVRLPERVADVRQEGIRLGG